jgi:hypothetical protein
LIFYFIFIIINFKVVTSGRFIERETKDCKMKKKKDREEEKMKKVRTIVSPGLRLKKEEKKMQKILHEGG